MKLYFKILQLCLICSFLIPGTDGTIRGKITDADGSALVGTQVYMPEIEKGTTADLDGNFILLNIPVGEYEVKFLMIGYQTKVMKGVNVIMDQTQWLNVSLAEASVEGEIVYVSSERAMVEKGTTSKKITISKEAIETLPIRDVSELYNLQSGVVKIDSKAKGIPDHAERGLEEVHVRGGRSGEIAYMIDGMYIRNPIYGGIGNGTRLNKFAIREFDWQPGGFNSEYGDAMSAVSNMHTASGKNEFRYRFKYETSLVGSAMGSRYDELRGYNDYNMGLGGKIPLVDKIPFINGAYYWASGQYTDNNSYRVYEFDDNTFGDVLEDNLDNLVTPWDTTSGFRDFGFDRTFDYFIKLDLKMLDNKLRVNYSYWNVDAHRKGFNPRYLYWDDGQNEIFRDTYRHTAEINHTLSNKTFYTLRYSSFIQDQFIGSRWLDSDNDGYPNWFENSYGAGSPIYSYVNDMTSDVNNENQVPFNPNETVNPAEVYYTNRDGNGPDQWSSGWYYGAPVPGNYNWEVAEDFIDVNGDGIFTEYFDANGDGFDDSFTGEWQAVGTVTPDDPFCNIGGMNSIQYQEYSDECESNSICSWEFIAGDATSEDGSIGTCVYNGGSGYYNPCVDCQIEVIPLSPTVTDYCQTNNAPLDILVRGHLGDAYGDDVHLGTLLMAVFDATAFNFISSDDTTIDEDMGYEFDPPIPASATQITDSNGEVYWIVRLPNDNCHNTNPDDPDVFSCDNIFILTETWWSVITSSLESISEHHVNAVTYNLISGAPAYN